MALNKVLDCAIMLCETSVNSNLKSGYKVDRKVNENYLDNSSWNAFKCEMKIKILPLMRCFQKAEERSWKNVKAEQILIRPKRNAYQVNGDKSYL